MKTITTFLCTLHKTQLLLLTTMIFSAGALCASELPESNKGIKDTIEAHMKCRRGAINNYEIEQEDLITLAEEEFYSKLQSLSGNDLCTYFWKLLQASEEASGETDDSSDFDEEYVEIDYSSQIEARCKVVASKVLIEIKECAEFKKEWVKDIRLLLNENPDVFEDSDVFGKALDSYLEGSKGFEGLVSAFLGSPDDLDILRDKLFAETKDSELNSNNENEENTIPAPPVLSFEEWEKQQQKGEKVSPKKVSGQEPKKGESGMVQAMFTAVKNAQKLPSEKKKEAQQVVGKPKKPVNKANKIQKSVPKKVARDNGRKSSAQPKPPKQLPRDTVVKPKKKVVPGRGNNKKVSQSKPKENIRLNSNNVKWAPKLINEKSSQGKEIERSLRMLQEQSLVSNSSLNVDFDNSNGDEHVKDEEVRVPHALISSVVVADDNQMMLDDEIIARLLQEEEDMKFARRLQAMENGVQGNNNNAQL